MGTQIQISSNNFAGHLADITFYPDTGGTVSYGYNLLPAIIDSDYIYGNYEIYISSDTKTCYSYVNNPNTNYLLQENNFTIDQEDGSKIIIT